MPLPCTFFVCVVIRAIVVEKFLRLMDCLPFTSSTSEKQKTEVLVKLMMLSIKRPHFRMLLNTFNCPIMCHCCVSWGDYTVSGINHQRCNFIYYAYALNNLLGETSGKYNVVWRLSAGFEAQ